ncbi:Glucan 1,3-beta-glucosidase [Smittium culicis]|uniref:glucan endo-1,3-beta-D-glucosidase n=1 Tax=Smittium culicis TaxID=133412 RepID=A0A1R1XQM3_9FUNG|nr:Glucan 1,3-beta-glucosidase [Smittium culicis]
MKVSIFSIFLAVTSASTFFHALTYNQSKDDGSCNTPDQVQKELDILKKYTGIVYSVGTAHCNQAEMIIEAIKKSPGLFMYLGIWFANDVDFNNELEAIKKLHSKYGLGKYVKTIVVGNYPISSKVSTVKDLVKKINTVEDFLVEEKLDEIEITVSDDWEIYDKRLVKAVDYITFSSFPYNLKVDYKNATNYLFEKLNKLKEKSRGKKVVFGQIGWPTSGDVGLFKGASVQNSQFFMNEFVCRTKSEGVDNTWFSAVDAPWMVANEYVKYEGSFGILERDRSSPKYKGEDWYNCKNETPEAVLKSTPKITQEAIDDQSGIEPKTEEKSDVEKAISPVEIAKDKPDNVQDKFESVKEKKEAPSNECYSAKNSY